MAQRRSWARYVIWGSFAVCAVFAAAFTIALVVGAHRGIQIAGFPKRPLLPALDRPQPGKVTLPNNTEHDLARMNDALRALAADRDRLATRLDQIERAVGDITASIKARDDSSAVPVAPASSRTPSPAPESESNPLARRPVEQITVVTTTNALPVASPPPPPAQQRTAAPVGTAPAATIGDPIDIFRPYAAVQPMVTPPAAAKAPMQIHAAPQTTESTSRVEPAPTRGETTATRTEFAIDLGTEPTIDGLRALWAGLRGNHGTALDGLRPLVSVREGAKPGSVELRLIAGPLANAGTAARTCAALQAKGVSCQTTVFDGQRLALR